MGPTNWRQALTHDVEVLDGTVKDFLKFVPHDTRRAIYEIYQTCWENGSNIPYQIFDVMKYWLHIGR